MNNEATNPVPRLVDRTGSQFPVGQWDTLGEQRHTADIDDRRAVAHRPPADLAGTQECGKLSVAKQAGRPEAA